jgi:hypothetical protein
MPSSSLGESSLDELFVELSGSHTIQAEFCRHVASIFAAGKRNPAVMEAASASLKAVLEKK